MQPLETYFIYNIYIYIMKERQSETKEDKVIVLKSSNYTLNN